MKKPFHAVKAAPSVILLILYMFLFSCTKQETGKPFFPGKYPGKPFCSISGIELMLSNEAIKVEWAIKDGSIVLKRISDKYDGQSLGLENIILFAVELEDGRKLTSHDFKLKSGPVRSELVAADSLPGKALRYPGIQVSAPMVSGDGKLEIVWTAQLREGSNYIRQNIQVRATGEPVRISRVILFDGNLEDAEYSGMVIGSPVWSGNFFFGFEHPIALSRALLARDIGPVSQNAADVTDLIDSPGQYVVTVELGSSADYFDIESVSLLADDRVVASDVHRFTGKGGNEFYTLVLQDYDPAAKYVIKADLVNPAGANGIFHLNRRTSGILNFYVDRSDELVPGKVISEWSVAGVSPPGQHRRAFLYYLERERARPYKQFLHYNCWWDITTDGNTGFSSDQLIERMNEWDNLFIRPYGVRLRSFVFDDGWDNLDSVWYFDPVRFPDGFRPEAVLCRKFNSGIGVWMSPFGGYGASRQRRLESAVREGLETNARGLSLAGPNYYNRFLDRALDMLDNYKVNYFKFDGFGGAEPEYLPDMEAGARLISTLRQHNPDVFINITVGSWPSPFWLRFADCTWRGSGDLHMAGKGTRTQKFMTYRDGTLHSNIVSKAPYYPLNSIMTVGIAYADHGLPEMYINDSINDFSDMVWSSFGAGSALQELYISPDRMRSDFWPVLADAAKWVKENEDIFHDTHWIGGSPLNLEIYGFASWTPRKGIITLRNPDDKAGIFPVRLDDLFELPENFRGRFLIKSTGPGEKYEAEVSSEELIKLEMKPFELKILEAVPR
jgi:hypothetical protein